MNVTKDKVSRLFNSAFPENPAWNRWYFDKVFSLDDAMLLDKGGNPVSTVTLARYTFLFAGSELPLAYLCNIATAEQARGKGYMSELIRMALNESYSRGDVFAALIPAYDRLYFFYDKFGFSTTIYLDCERYTSVHKFIANPDYRIVPADCNILDTLERNRQNTVLHTPEQFARIIEDLEMEGGTAAAAVSVADGSPAAIAFASPSHDGDELVVREILAVNDDAAETVLAQLRYRYPDLRFVINAMPGQRRAALRARGMMRLVNVEKALEAMARRYPDTEQVIRVHDSIIPNNNGVYVLHRGTCQRQDATMRRLSLDVDVRVLTSILFSSEKVGQVFGLSTSRAMLPLMLD